MRIYRVGGAVRDALLGEPSHDSDWVVVGATPEQMIEAGYQPVGRDFPVFLHPDTHEEYALARTERKTGAGYRGFAVHFAPDVTLEDDLLRRDLTINAMAMSAEGELIDPYGGRDDLRDGLFRHVSDAFAEDPVRILRVARFAARLTRFRVHPDTLALMRRMVAAGEADALVPERVWQEVSRGLMQAEPYRMIAVLADCGALARALPGIEPGPVLEASLACAASADAPLSARYALLVAAGSRGGDDRGGDPLAERLRVPVDCRDIARLLLAEHDALDRVPHCDARALLALLERLDALRRPQRIEPLAAAAACLAHARAEGGRLPDAADAPCPPGVAQHAQAVAQRLHDARAVARAVDAGRIAQARLADGPEAVRAAIFEARAASIEAAGV